MTETQNRLMKLAEVFITQDPNQKDHVTKIMLAKGIIIQMESELIIFEKKKGKSEKSTEQLERINLLKLAVDTFSDVSSNNLQIGHILYAYNELIKSYERKLDEYDEQMVIARKMLGFDEIEAQ